MKNKLLKVSTLSIMSIVMFGFSVNVYALEPHSQNFGYKAFFIMEEGSSLEPVAQKDEAKQCGCPKDCCKNKESCKDKECCKNSPPCSSDIVA